MMKIVPRQWLALSPAAKANLIIAEFRENCRHENRETIPISGSYEAYTVCHDCGAEI
ncbi:hypothetical protein [Bacillus paralicheniformis]|uniref:hypothetical protein n=2 Tax=Bacillus paralicheniformis TaxID=1648923 RepID=UPI001CC761D5|nr:hypothetical protein [Bacillus paralicheniformis]UAY70701.1 hypothetical protein K8336_01005 [Bacillus paralicheniformis]